MTVLDKCESFALRIIRLYSHLCEEHEEYIISRRLLNAGISIGASVAESGYAIGKADRYSKTYAALKRIAETEYWLALLHRTGYLTDPEYASISRDAGELRDLLFSVAKSQKQLLARK